MNVKKLCLFLVPLVLTGCLSMPSPSMHVRIQAAKQLNPDTSLNSLPVRVKIYQLSDPTLFKEATFRQLWKTDSVSLGSTMLDKREMTINPGETQTINMTRNAQAEVIAVVGVFRQHEDNGWKAVKPLPGQVNTLIKTLSVEVKGHSVEIK